MTAAQLDFLSASTAAFTSADEWRRENPEAYAAVVAWAHEDAMNHRPCAMQRYIEFLRDPDMMPRRYVHRLDAVYLVNHNVRSALTRLVLSEYPSLPFAIRKSTCDGPLCPAANPRSAVETLGRAAAGEGHGNVPAAATRTGC